MSRTQGTSPWGWVLLLVAGQAASLALIAAGNRVGYQHYSFTSRGVVTWLAVGVLLLQAALVVRGLRAWGAPLHHWVQRQLTGGQRLVLLVAVVMISATASQDLLAYASELVVASVVQLLAVGNAILLGRSLDAAAIERRITRWFGGATEPARSRIDPFSLACAAWVLVAGSFLALVVYQNHPHVPDEVIYLLHARYFAEGRLSLPPPPAPLAFNIDLMYYEPGRWFSPVPPGWPLVLAAGAFFGVPWLVNPALGAVNILLTYALLTSMYERRVARLATLFLAVSPWFVFMSMNFMTHQVTLSCALLGALAIARVRRERQQGVPASARTLAITLAGGVAIGMASLVRPLEGLATALLLGVWSLPPRWWTLLTRPLAFVPSFVLAVGAMVGGAPVRWYNAALTGDPSRFPIMAYIDKYYAKGSNDLGFGANRGLGWTGLDPFPGHGPADVVVNANLNITTTNVELLGWATGSLLVVLLLFALRRWRREDAWHLAVIATIAGIHSFYWFSGGPDFGARYWYLIIVSCVTLAARGVVELGNSLTSASADGASPSHGQSRAIGVALALTLVMAVTFLPWRAIDKYHYYRGMRPDVRELAVEQKFGRSLVFIRGKRHPDYASAVPYNPLDLRADAPLYAWDASQEARTEALRAYPDRPVWFLDGPTVSGDGFRVAAGPLTSAEALTFGQP